MIDQRFFLSNYGFSICKYMIFIKFLKCTLIQKIVIIVQLCPTLCDPMNCSISGFPVLFYLPEFAQTHVHWVGDAIQLSHPLPLPSPTSHIRVFSNQGQLFASDVGASASTSVLPMNIQGWFTLLLLFFNLFTF